jgi:HK97 family phage portal protein
MKIFGMELTRKRAPTSVTTVDSRRGWWPIIFESSPGAWQRNETWTVDTVLAYHAVYACVTLIANDIGKLRPKLVERVGKIWQETTSPAFSPVLRRPNRYQNHIQFKQWWITSKLLRGNTYALKQRDGRGVVTALYLLDPSRVEVLVATDGSVYYKLGEDNLSGQGQPSVTVPASEIIHDRMNCLFHPLVGISPIFAAGSAANIGVTIQTNSTGFFGNGSRPGGVLTAPGAISDETAARLKAHWDAGYTGENAGKVAVLGDGLKFEPMRLTAVESQLIEQLKWTAEVVCSVFHVPAFMVGIGNAPTYNNIEALSQQYYSQCLQSLIEEMEACLDDGLGLMAGPNIDFGIELDLDGLLRMDSATMMATLEKGVGASIYSPDEARARLDLPPVPGGSSPMAQQQYYSLEALSKRDAAAPMPGTPAPPAPAGAVEDDDTPDAEEELRTLLTSLKKGFADA